jgi:hypothetical protein
MTSSQENRNDSLVATEAAPAAPAVAMQNFVTILGCDILSDIFEYLTMDTIAAVQEHNNKNDTDSLRSIMEATDNWSYKRRAYHEKTISLTALSISRYYACLVFATESTIVDNIFEYLSDDDISNLKQTNMLSDDPPKNPFILPIMKLQNTVKHRNEKLTKYLDYVDDDKTKSE